jgi:ubiquinone/menaquinone biosynthesis C-methylase UbiE
MLRASKSRQDTRAYYDRLSRVYGFLAERSEGPVREAGLRELGVKPGEEVLEIGFGTGHCLVTLLGAAGNHGAVYGLDISEGMLRRAISILRKKQLHDRVGLICGDASLLPFQTGVMDAVFMSFTLELFDTPDIPLVLAECRRVLKPGGRIAVVSMSKEGESTALVHAFEWTHEHFPHFLDCRPIFVGRALEAAGFQIVSSEIQKMWVPIEIVMGVGPR